MSALQTLPRRLPHTPDTFLLPPSLIDLTFHLLPDPLSLSPLTWGVYRLPCRWHHGTQTSCVPIPMSHPPPSVSLLGTRLDTTTTCDEPGIYLLAPWYLDVEYCLSSLQLYCPPLPFEGEQDGIEIRFIQSEDSLYCASTEGLLGVLWRDRGRDPI